MASDKSIGDLLYFFRQKREKKLNSGFPDNWDIDTDSITSESEKANKKYPYEFTFSELLKPFNDFVELARERIHSGKTAYFLDLFGSGRFIADKNVATGVLGIRNKDISTIIDQRLRPVNWSILESNIYDLYSSKTDAEIRSGIESYLEKNGIAQFDFIICRPVGPFENYNMPGFSDYQDYDLYDPMQYAQIYYKLISEFYKYLSPEDGVMFTEVPTFKGSKIYGKKLVSLLKELEFDVELAEAPTYWSDGRREQVVKLTKHTNSHKYLPPFPMLHVEDVALPISDSQLV